MHNIGSLFSLVNIVQIMAFLRCFRGAAALRPRTFMALSTGTNNLANAPTISLRDGTTHPIIGFGTYKVGFIPASASAAAAGAEAAGGTEITARGCVADALAIGYRFLDCAEFYGNEIEVGLAIQDSGVPRSELYLASKCWTTTIWEGRAAVRRQVLKTIEDLGAEYSTFRLYSAFLPLPSHLELRVRRNTNIKFVAHLRFDYSGPLLYTLAGSR